MDNEYVVVAVSKERQTLRDVQEELNGFLWSTELCYGHFLSAPGLTFGDLERPTSQVLGHVISEAWYPTTHGNPKYDPKMSRMLDVVRANTTHVYRAVMLSFVAAFERYLSLRMRALQIAKPNGVDSWGPYYLSLSHPRLTNARDPVQLKTLIAADICRWLRNNVAHPSAPLPDGRAQTQNYYGSAFRNLHEFNACHATSAADLKARMDFCKSQLERAIDFTVGHAEDERSKASKLGKKLPIEFFYAIFTLTNIDNLAFEFEEATIDRRQQTVGRIFRRRRGIRRHELIVRGTGVTDHTRLDSSSLVP